MSIEAMKMALEALEWISDVRQDEDDEAGECASCHERSYKPHAPDCAKQNAITALRAAIAEASMQRLTDVQQEMEQEPVAWMSLASESMIGKTDENGSAYHIITTSKKTANNSVPLYTHPPRREWVGLTIGELSALYDKHAKCQEEGMLVSGWLDFAAEHDALLKENNS